MLSGSIKHHYQTWQTEARRQALAQAYVPIVRGFLLPGAAYYLFVTWGHWKDESGLQFAVLGGLSLLTAVLYEVFRRFVLAAEQVPSARLEAVGIATNALMYANVLTYMALHFEEEKLIYFTLMAVVFSTSGVTLRATVGSVILSIGTMLLMAYNWSSPERFNQFAFIGVATSFASLGMATLLRKAILRQIDARLAADEMAASDSLTGIANRRTVFGRMEQLIRNEQPFWAGILDLDGFKSINDVYGHKVGDQLLCDVVKRLSVYGREDVMFGRIGGDEFAILVPGEAEPNLPELLGEKIISDISRPYEISYLQLEIFGTIGFAHYPSMGETAQNIYEKADFALYRGKKLARGTTVIFTLDEDREMLEGLAHENGLREAKLDDELYLVFQPQFQFGGEIVGFEALARWHSPTLGYVPPDKFIRAAERAGLIQNVTRILFRQGLDALASWSDGINLSFNLSAQDIGDRAFIFSLVAEVLRRGIDPDRVEFEVTETAVMKDIAASRLLLSELKDVGFKIALDDFGSGYSSFEYIDQLPLDKIKVDKSFVRRVGQSVAAREIIAAITTLCRNLNLNCVLEGVETEEEMNILSVLNPTLIQGYLFGKPLNEIEALRLMDARSSRCRGQTVLEML